MQSGTLKIWKNFIFRYVPRYIELRDGIIKIYDKIGGKLKG